MKMKNQTRTKSRNGKINMGACALAWALMAGCADRAADGVGGSERSVVNRAHTAEATAPAAGAAAAPLPRIVPRKRLAEIAAGLAVEAESEAPMVGELVGVGRLTGSARIRLTEGRDDA